MQDTKISISDGQFLVGSDGIIEHQAMTRAIHGFETEFLFIDVNDEHIILVMLVVTGTLPEITIIHIRGNHFSISTDGIFLSDQIHQLIIDMSTLGHKEGTSRTPLMEHKQVLLLSDVSVITFGGFFLEMLPFSKLLLGGERDTIHSLQLIITFFGQPLSGGILGTFHSLNFTGMGNVRSSTKINQITTSVSSGVTTVGDLVCDQLLLEGIVFEHLQGLLLGQHDLLELLFLLSDLLSSFVDGGEIGLTNTLLTDIRIVIEAGINRWTNTEITTVDVFHGFSQNMGTGMPEDHLSFLVIKGEEMKFTITFQRSSHIYQFVLLIGTFFTVGSSVDQSLEGDG
mmetsp:Transcript_15827/g.17658  ORF Transcript_15827/g.17658 Transcript_15827/m.17658 type:complete len:341 (-) Transcript_15827:831-1853(-)